VPLAPGVAGPYALSGAGIRLPQPAQPTAQVTAHATITRLQFTGASSGDRTDSGPCDSASGPGVAFRSCSSVDGRSTPVIGQLLLDLNAGGQTQILVTHSPELAARYARRTIGLVDGRIADDTRGAPASVPVSHLP